MPTSKRYKNQFISAVLFMILGLLSACSPSKPSNLTSTPSPVYPTVTTGPTVTPLPSPTPTPFPLGDQNNPVIMGVVKTGATGQETAGQKLVEELSSNEALSVQFKIYDNYTNLLIDMKLGNLQMAWLPPVTYTLAHEQGYANVAMLTNHFGVYQFGSQFFARVDTGLSSYFDDVNNKNTADAKTALSQLNGKRPCYVDLQSTSGYVIPQGFLFANGFRTEPAVIAQSHTAVIRALYTKGICDFGATFATTGDPRTASTVLSDLTDVKEKVFILWKTPEIIPNLNLSFQPAVSPDLRNKITQLLLKLVQTDEGRTLLSDANDYEIESLQPVDDVVYNEFRAYLQASEADPIPLMGK